MRKGMISMPQILPIKDLKNTSNISEMCHKADEPIYITKNGYGDMVLMSIELFEKTQKKWNMYSDIEQSEQQIKEGRIKDARKSLSAVKEKYGL
nr:MULTISPECIES: type II toxin-antitoxin system Phd/YefM family antitoxin [Pseudobutyrivibrio]